ncbi:MAG: hypothetical protein IK079_03350, partial [Desulfovibrio sp.]|nr:hypothetical protein [Desulfovibrio sp.]
GSQKVENFMRLEYNTTHQQLTAISKSAAGRHGEPQEQKYTRPDHQQQCHKAMTAEVFFPFFAGA